MVMYYHGLLENGDQVTRVAVSKDGLNFKSKKLILGPSYFRVFRFNSFFMRLPMGEKFGDHQDLISRSKEVLKFCHIKQMKVSDVVFDMETCIKKITFFTYFIRILEIALKVYYLQL